MYAHTPFGGPRQRRLLHVLSESNHPPVMAVRQTIDTCRCGSSVRHGEKCTKGFNLHACDNSGLGIRNLSLEPVHALPHPLGNCPLVPALGLCKDLAPTLPSGKLPLFSRCRLVQRFLLCGHRGILTNEPLSRQLRPCQVGWRAIWLS